MFQSGRNVEKRIAWTLDKLDYRGKECHAAMMKRGPNVVRVMHEVRLQDAAVP
jgi:hypothetical protein